MITAVPLVTALILQAIDAITQALYHCQTVAAQMLTDRLVHLMPIGSQ